MAIIIFERYPTTIHKVKTRYNTAEIIYSIDI